MGFEESVMAGGIGSGLMGFADSYMKRRQMDQMNNINQQYVDLAKQRQNSEFTKQGLVAGPDQSVKFTDPAQKLYDAELNIKQNDLDRKQHLRDKNSELTKATQAVMKSVWSKNPETAPFADQIENLSGQDIEDIAGPASNYVGGETKFENQRLLNRENANERVRGLLEGAQAKDLIDQNKISTQFQNQMELQDKKHQADLEKLREEFKGKKELQTPALQNKLDVEESKGQNKQDLAEMMQLVKAEKAKKDERQKWQFKINGDQNVQGARQSIQQGESALVALNQALANPTAANLAQLSVIRSAIGKNRMNQMELQMGGLDQSWGGKFEQWLKKADQGTLTPNNVKDMQKYVSTMNEVNKKHLKDSVMDYVNQYGNNVGVIKEQAWHDLLGTDYPTEVQKAAPIQKSGGSPKNAGHKIGDIITDSSGVQWKKVKNGPDKDKSNFEKVGGGGLLDKAKGFLGL